MFCLLLLAAVPEAPPVLLMPEEAKAAVEATSPPGWAVEAFLLAGDARGAESRLSALDGASPAHIRLKVDTWTALSDDAALEALPQLAAHPTWAQHARRVTHRMQLEQDRISTARIGMLLFALCLGLLVLGGARELLRPSSDTLIVGLAVAVALLLLGQISKPLMTVMGLLGVSALALCHAGTASVRRTAAGPRARTLVATLMLLGLVGAGLAVLGRIGPRSVLGILG